LRVLIVSESERDRDTMARCLVGQAHIVETASSTGVGLKQLDAGTTEVLVLDWVTTKPSTTDVIERVRTAEGTRHIYTIVVMAEPAPTSVSAAFAAGADDLLRRPFLREELMARVGAIERIRRWAAKAMGQIEELHAKIARLQLGRAANLAIVEDLGSLLQRPLEPRAATNLAGRRVVAVEIPLSFVEEEIECRLQVAVDAASLDEASSLLLGTNDVSAEAVADVLRELANVAGGALVGAAEADGISATLGLPTNLPPDLEWDKPSGTAQERTLGIVGTGIELTLRVVVSSRELKSLFAKQLRPGMVVARNVGNGEGAVLVPAGTCLTEASVERLATALQAGSVVVVLAG
jgi:DNA-binding response OmpR family regulator